MKTKEPFQTLPTDVENPATDWPYQTLSPSGKQASIHLSSNIRDRILESPFLFFFLQQFLSLRSTDICVHDTQWISQLASRWPIMNHREHTCKITHTCTHSHACRYQSLFLLPNTWHTRTWGRPHMMKFSKTNMLKLTDKRK